MKQDWNNSTQNRWNIIFCSIVTQHDFFLIRIQHSSCLCIFIENSVRFGKLFFKTAYCAGLYINERKSLKAKSVFVKLGDWIGPVEPSLHLTLKIQLDVILQLTFPLTICKSKGPKIGRVSKSKKSISVFKIFPIFLDHTFWWNKYKLKLLLPKIMSTTGKKHFCSIFFDLDLTNEYVCYEIFHRWHELQPGKREQVKSRWNNTWNITEVQVVLKISSRTYRNCSIVVSYIKYFT